MLRTLVVATALASAAVAAAAQEPTAEQKVAAFRQLLTENQQKRRLFTWLETTQVAYEGTVKLTRVSDCQYPLAGRTPACTTVGIQQAPPPSGFVRRRIAEEREQAIKAYMDTVRTVVAEYVPTQFALVQQAYEHGNVRFSPDPETGVSRMTIVNYKLPGDTLTIAYAAAQRRIRWVKLSTYVGSSSAPVTATVTFATLPNGVFYAYRKVLDVPKQQIAVTITQTDFSELVEQP